MSWDKECLGIKIYLRLIPNTKIFSFFLRRESLIDLSLCIQYIKSSFGEPPGSKVDVNKKYISAFGP